MNQKAVEVIREILKKRDEYDARKRPFRLLERVISEGVRTFNPMSGEYGWRIPTELYNEIKKEVDRDSSKKGTTGD